MFTAKWDAADQGKKNPDRFIENKKKNGIFIFMKGNSYEFLSNI